MTDFNEFLNTLFPNIKETKEQITNKYITGVISKEEFIKRMKLTEKGE